MNATEIDLIPLESVPDYLPRRRGRKHHRSTIFRWASQGVAGTRLRTVRMGRTKCTRIVWLEEFFEALGRQEQSK